MSTELGQLGSNTLIQGIANQILNIGIEQNQSQITFCSKIEKEAQLVEIELPGTQF